MKESRKKPQNKLPKSPVTGAEIAYGLGEKGLDRKADKIAENSRKKSSF